MKCLLAPTVKHHTSFVYVSHRRLDVQVKHDSDPDKKHSEASREEKHSNEHNNKKAKADDPRDEKHPDKPQNEKHPQKTRKEKPLEEPQKQRPAEDHQLEQDDKNQRQEQDVHREKHQPQPAKETEPQKLRQAEELKKEKRGHTDDTKKDKHREENSHERPINPPSEPQREKPGDSHKPLFERWEEGASDTEGDSSKPGSGASPCVVYFRRGVLDSSVLYPSRFPSPPRPARSSHPIKRPSLDIKKDRSGPLHGLCVNSSNARTGTAWVICADICSCGVPAPAVRGAWCDVFIPMIWYLAKTAATYPLDSWSVLLWHLPRKDVKESSCRHPRAPRPASPLAKRPSLEVKRERSGPPVHVRRCLSEFVRRYWNKCFISDVRKLPPDPNAPIAPLPLHLHPPPRSLSACPLALHHIDIFCDYEVIQLGSRVSVRLERSLLTPTLLFLRFHFTFTLHLLPQSITHWMGKRRAKGLSSRCMSAITASDTSGRIKTCYLIMKLRCAVCHSRKESSDSQPPSQKKTSDHTKKDRSRSFRLSLMLEK